MFKRPLQAVFTNPRLRQWSVGARFDQTYRGAQSKVLLGAVSTVAAPDTPEAKLRTDDLPMPRSTSLPRGLAFTGRGATPPRIHHWNTSAPKGASQRQHLRHSQWAMSTPSNAARINLWMKLFKKHWSNGPMYPIAMAGLVWMRAVAGICVTMLFRRVVAFHSTRVPCWQMTNLSRSLNAITRQMGKGSGSSRMGHNAFTSN